VAKVRNENSHYSRFTAENNVTLVQSFVNNELRDMIGTIMQRDDVKLGAFVEWACAIGVNEANKEAGIDERFDVMKLHYANHKRANNRQALRNENQELRDMLKAQQAMIEQLMSKVSTTQDVNNHRVNAITFNDAQ
jgi:hypothetical protein